MVIAPISSLSLSIGTPRRSSRAPKTLARGELSVQGSSGLYDALRMQPSAPVAATARARSCSGLERGAVRLQQADGGG